jgi:hypothetical protein
VFSPGPGYLWVTVPPRPEKFFATGDELWLIDLRVMRVVDWRLLEAIAAGCEPVPILMGRPSAWISAKGRTAR